MGRETEERIRRIYKTLPAWKRVVFLAWARAYLSLRRIIHPGQHVIHRKTDR